MPWPILVVSLSDAHERRESITRQFRDHDLEFEFVDAVDGRNGLPAEYESRIDRAGARARLRRDLSDAEFACALSHQSIYERIVSAGGGAIVLEDDAILTDAFVGFVRDRVYEAGDFIQFDYNIARAHHWARKQQIGGISLIPLACNADWASGYSLSCKAANFILANSRPISGVADWPCDLMPINPMVTLPRLAAQAERVAGQSTLEDARKALQSTVAKPFYFRDGEEFSQIRLKRFARPKFWAYVGKELGIRNASRRLWFRLTTRRIESPAP